MDYQTIGNEAEFAVRYAFFDETGATEIEMLCNGANILGFRHGGVHKTTRWNLDGIVEWLSMFVQTTGVDPFPVDAEGEFTAERDANARCFEVDDLDEFDAYYDAIEEWEKRHRWHNACDGAVLSDVFFCNVENGVEISWDNRDQLPEYRFDCQLGGMIVDARKFHDVIVQFIRAYATQWD